MGSVQNGAFFYALTAASKDNRWVGHVRPERVSRCPPTEPYVHISVHTALHWIKQRFFGLAVFLGEH